MSGKRMFDDSGTLLWRLEMGAKGENYLHCIYGRNVRGFVCVLWFEGCVHNEYYQAEINRTTSLCRRD